MSIVIQGAAENNLQEIDVEFSSGLTVVTGVSGSGKTSLVFDTLYHEARRRFLESFSTASSAIHLAPARVRAIQGLGPAVAVGQNLLNRNPSSILATASGLHPFFRLLYTRFGARRCASCGAELQVWSADAILTRVVELARQAPLEAAAPLLRAVQGSHRTLLALLEERFGRSSLRVDGRVWSGAALDPLQPHTIEVTLAQLAGTISPTEVRAVLDGAAALGATTLIVRSPSGAEWTFARAPVCGTCGAWFGSLEPVHFHAACPHCQGTGCPACDGTGLHPEAASVSWQGLRLPDLLALSVSEASQIFLGAELPAGSERLREEILRRLEALQTAGLGYIQLNRPSPTLSRGESQRVRLAVTLVSRLEDMLHVLDEPTVGLHPADIDRLMPAFRRLAGPVIYVEHDRSAAAFADHAVDLGPGAGSQGGRIVYAGTPAGLWAAETPTGRAFSLRDRVLLPQRRHSPKGFLVVRGADLRTLRSIDVPIPLGQITVVTGVSGSGKSTLVEDVLVASLEAGEPHGCAEIEGPLLKAVMVDQSPIGINPRSNPATYTGLADIIRDLFSYATGLPASRFSFNRPEGACPTCAGMGAVEVQLRYLPSTWIPCADCQGQRFSEEVLSARVDFTNPGGESLSLSIADVFRLPIQDIAGLLVENEHLLRAKQREARAILQALRDVGLGYLTLGQPSPSLSGGEAQRVKLTRFLGKTSLAGRMVVLDEPSTGLHPRDVTGLLVVLDRLARGGATVVVVEHNLDILRAADWIIDLGPGAGPQGGQLIYAGPPDGLAQVSQSLTGRALREEEQVRPNDAAKEVPGRQSAMIAIRDARANNLRGVSVDFPKGALSVVTGVSGSGKSSLVSDVLENEARRRYLESLSMYERQGVREGPEAPVGSVSGLGMAVRPGTERGLYDRRATVGVLTSLSYHLAGLLSRVGERSCPSCEQPMQRERHGRGEHWRCRTCGQTAPVGEPRHFLPNNYAAACLTCHGVGSMQVPAPEKLIIHPEKPVCAGAMYSPGFFPKGYLGKPYNGGYDQVQAMAAKYGFDPFTTPWIEMTPEAQHAFLFGDPEPMPVHYVSRNGRTRTEMQGFPGFYGYIRDWDVGGTYTNTQPCPTCQGSRLRPEYAHVCLNGQPAGLLGELPLWDLLETLNQLPASPSGDLAGLAAFSLDSALTRLRFMVRVGLGYLNLNRLAATLSAGEAQRVRLAGLLGSQLTGLTVLLDEPTRGLHPSEIEALLAALLDLRGAGNTVIVVEHEPLFMHAADFLVDMGPGAGTAGGQVVAQGQPAEVLKGEGTTARWLRGERRMPDRSISRRIPSTWMVLRGARGHNLRGDAVSFPLGVMAGVCGVSGSGKSTLVIDTLGRVLAPRKVTTSVSREPLDPEPYESLEGAPPRTVLVDQSRAGMHSPAAFLDLTRPLAALFAAGADAQSLGLSEELFKRRCSACGGSGVLRLDMGFLPPVSSLCETCRGSGFSPEAWEARLGGLALPELFGQTIEEVRGWLQHLKQTGTVVNPDLFRPFEAARSVGLGYLVLNQPGDTLSGGEAQRLKIAAELCRRSTGETLYILDEPTVGQHLEDVERLAGVLHSMVDAGHSVLVVEHHPHLLAACDWLIELGPGGGPRGGQVIASGAPETLAVGQTPIAPYLREVLR